MHHTKVFVILDIRENRKKEKRVMKICRPTRKSSYWIKTWWAIPVFPRETSRNHIKSVIGLVRIMSFFPITTLLRFGCSGGVPLSMVFFFQNSMSYPVYIFVGGLPKLSLQFLTSCGDNHMWVTSYLVILASCIWVELKELIMKQRYSIIIHIMYSLRCSENHSCFYL